MEDISLDKDTHEVSIGPSFVSHMGKNMLNNLLKNEKRIYQIESISGTEETCGSVRTRSIRVAEHLKTRGLKVGDVVMMCAKNHNDSCIPFIASQFIGAIPASLVLGMTHIECVHLIRVSKPRIIFSDPEMIEVIKKATTELKMTVEIVVFGVDENFTPFSDFVKPVPNENDFQCTDFDTSISISYAACSSGTTGFPKFVAVTHLAIVAGMALIKKYLIDAYKRDEADDGSQLVFSPLYWSTGLISVFVSSLYGSTRILSVKPFSPEIVRNALEKYKPATMFLSPAGIHEILRHPDVDKFDFSSIRSISSGGSPLDEDAIKKMEKYLPNGRVIFGYGSTEVLSVSFGSFAPGSVGRVNPWLKWMITDVDTGAELGPNKQGEIRLKGISMFKEYYNDPEATKAAFDSNGYYKSGDMGYYDEDNNLFIVDRVKESIKYQNYQINSYEVENLISTLPEVMAVAVVGFPDRANGELPMAIVQKVKGASIDAQKIKDLVKDNLSDFKHLRGGVAFVDNLPMTYTGKIDRRALKMLKIIVKRE